MPYVFEVVSGHKGDITEPMTVWSAASGASCGLELAEGSSASLFVQKVGDRWEGALCQTMGPEALAEFPEVTVGDAPEPNPLDDPSSNVARWVLGGLAVGAVGALAITRLRRNDASTMPES